MTYKPLPTPKNAEGKDRSVGFELEFAGIEIDQTAHLVHSLFGGTIEKENRYLINIRDSSLGNFAVELDAQLLQRMANENILDKYGINPEEKSIRKSIEDTVDRLAKSVVPLEIVMPPVKVSELHRMEELRKALQQNKAEGTRVSVVHAFGMHINVEAPDLTVPTLHRYLKAFILLYPWLLDTLNIDFTRRVSPFVYPFSERYVRKVLDADYKPVEEQFIQDYLKENPTRNRPLDLMPIFGMINQSLVKSVVEGGKNKPRPTFHYRMPNSRIDDPDWRFQDEWSYWLVVEQLSENEEMLEKLSRLYLLREEETVMSFRREWAKTLEILLDLDE